MNSNYPGESFQTLRLLQLIIALSFFAFLSKTPGEEAVTAFEVRAVSSSPGSATEPVTYDSGKEKIAIYIQKEAVLALNDLKEVSIVYNQHGFEIELELTPQATARFSNFVSKHPGERVAVLTSGKLVSAPLLPNKPVTSKTILIGPYLEAKQREIYSLIKATLGKGQ